MPSLSPMDFFPGAKRDAALRRQRAMKGGVGGALQNALSDFVSVSTPVPALNSGPGSLVPATTPQSLPVPPNMQAAMPGTNPAFYYGPPPAGFLPNETYPNVDGAVIGCCPSLASQTPPGNDPGVFGNAVTTVAALADTLAPFAPPETGMRQPQAIWNADLAISGQIQAAQQTKIPTLQMGPSSAKPGAMSIAMPKSIAGAFNLLSTRAIFAEPDQVTADVATFGERSYMPGTGQGGNSLTDKDKITGLMGLGDDYDNVSLPGWFWPAALCAVGYWVWKGADTRGPDIL
jgi:hypothetical protein